MYICFMIYVTRKERFNAAHKMWKAEWSEEKNKEVFGKCANVNWHGHNYDLFVTVKGELQETGYVVDLKLLSDLINKRVIDLLDHKNINLDVEFMKGKMTSTENLTIGIWNLLEASIKNELNCILHSVKLYETENNFAEYFG
jgi:6-pyruvoyltetrahydropterin/6-carboxytetrahydropterin synthase